MDKETIKQQALAKHKDIISPYNNARSIITSKVDNICAKLERNKSKTALVTVLEELADVSIDVDFDARRDWADWDVTNNEE